MKPFPKRITIDLPEALRSGLETIAEMGRSQSPDDLVRVTLSKGIVFTLSDSTDLNESHRAEEVAQNLERLKEHLRSLQQAGEARFSKKTSSSNVRPFPAPSVLYKRKLDHMHAKQKADLAAANHPDRDESPSNRSSEVEHISAPIPEDLRLRLDQFLHAHPELDQEQGIAILLGLGLDQSQRGVKTRTATDKMVELGERLHAKTIRSGLA